MKFFDTRSGQQVEIPKENCRRTYFMTKTKNGDEIKYAVLTTYNNTKMTKFITKEEYFELKGVPYVSNKSSVTKRV